MSSDVINAIQQQNDCVAAGQINMRPAPAGEDFRLTIDVQGNLLTAEELDYTVAFDITVFFNASVNEVHHAVFEVGVLVLLVIIVFLQDWRATPGAGDDGAGSGARKSRGLTVISGMTAFAGLAVVFVPAFHVVLQRRVERQQSGET